MLNLLILLGRATKEPELRKSGETSIVNFDIAVDNPRREGEEKSTTFMKVVCFKRVADNVSKFVKAGDRVAVTGSLIQRNYTAKDGTKRSVYECIADSVEFLEPKPVESFVQGGDIDDEPELPETKEDEATAPAPKFDPYTGEPLKPAKKK